MAGLSETYKNPGCGILNHRNALSGCYKTQGGERVKKTAAKGHTRKHAKATTKHAKTAKHHPVHHVKAATAHGTKVHAKAKPATHAKAKGLALAPGDVACCVSEALAASLRLQGLPVTGADVLRLHRLAGADDDRGAPVPVVLEAAAEFGLGGVRPTFDVVACGDYLADDPQLAGVRRVFGEFSYQPEQQAVPRPEPFAVADAQVLPFGVLPPFLQFAARDGQEHGRAEFTAAPPRVVGVADLDVEAIRGEIADGGGCRDFVQGHLSHGPERGLTGFPLQLRSLSPLDVSGRFKTVRDAPTEPTGTRRNEEERGGKPQVPAAIPGNVSATARVSGVSLILGLELPGSHAVLATPEGWWSWGELWCPCEFPDAVIDGAWLVSWAYEESALGPRVPSAIRQGRRGRPAASISGRWAA